VSRSSLRQIVTGAVVLCLSVTTYSLLHYSGLLIPLRTGLIYVGVLVLTCLTDLLVVWRLTNSTDTEYLWIAHQSLKWGLLIAGFWLIEMVTGNLLDARSGTVRTLYFGSSLLAFMLPLFAGIWGSRKSGRVRAGMLMGLWSGIVSGLLAFLILMTITYLFLNIMRSDPQNVLQFQGSGARDLTTFVVGDSLAGATGHLVIGPVLGSGLGLVGGVIGKALGAKPATNENLP
jgi:hypothetical protein